MSHQDLLSSLLKKINEIIYDNEASTQLALTALLAEGHLLIEDVPGRGKTSLVRGLSKLLGLPSQRIQFTNDLLPADLIGTSIFDKNTGDFRFHQGPLFSNFILADEINRASPRTQSACLQAMEEISVSVDRTTYNLPKPFFVVATQNPLESSGTFQLPESQLDRFLFKISLQLPSRQSERELISSRDRKDLINELQPIFDQKTLLEVILKVDGVRVSEPVLDYIQDVVEKSRQLSNGLSPRAARGFFKSSRAYALIEGRDYVIPEDVQAVAPAIMGHRLKSHEQQLSERELCEQIIHSVPVP